MFSSSASSFCGLAWSRLTGGLIEESIDEEAQWLEIVGSWRKYLKKSESKSLWGIMLKGRKEINRLWLKWFIIEVDLSC